MKAGQDLNLGLSGASLVSVLSHSPPVQGQDLSVASHADPSSSTPEPVAQLGPAPAGVLWIWKCLQVPVSRQRLQE